MKNILILLLLGLFSVYGCKYFKPASARQIDTISQDTGLSNDIVDSSAYYSSMSNASPAVSSTPVKTNAASGNYYMIVGCFMVKENADKYAEKLKGMGYEPLIIPGRDNFQMVAARNYDNYRTSVSEIDKFRNEVSPNAWVYRKR